MVRSMQILLVDQPHQKNVIGIFREQLRQFLQKFLPPLADLYGSPHSSAPVEEKRRLIEPGHEMISICRQCELLELPRSSYYYAPRPTRRFTVYPR